MDCRSRVYFWHIQRVGNARLRGQDIDGAFSSLNRQRRAATGPSRRNRVRRSVRRQWYNCIRAEYGKSKCALVRAELCMSNVLPLNLLNTLLETATIDECKRAFDIVEEHGDHWRKV